MATAILRTDASARIGGGHVMRCRALADALTEHGWSCTFVSVRGSAAVVPEIASGRHGLIEIDPNCFDLAEPSGGITKTDLLVVDHYGLDAAFETACRPWARRIMVIDDLADRPHDCDILLDQTLGREADDYRDLVPSECRLLMGSGYALLRPQFAQSRLHALARHKSGDIRRVLVSMGATDDGSLAAFVLESMALAMPYVSVDVVLGHAPSRIDLVRRQAARFQDMRLLTDVEDMAALMVAADLAIGAGGSTSWERCCLGLPAVMVVIAENQRLIARRLEAAGAVVLVEHTVAALVAALRAVLDSPARLSAMASAAAAICDGEGTLRVVKEIEQ